MSSHEEHHSESPKKVYFGVPIAFALSFWFIVFLSLKACDGGSREHCKEECSKECMEKCKAEGKDCAKSCEENAKETKEGEKVGAGLESDKAENSDGKKPSTEEGKPDSPSAVEGEKSPTEKHDSAKGH